ncbi:HEAT repeat domain-containing protein [Candidatus Trichorickettsia mobilis]|uniref:HEAT repeat domain-containing protein n=1 Tax=Candidatus Trichorickettsia mobilis TaxID=1346319 RepID=UPI0029317F71|nr:HEAT repeat domain-containing protein [Candidatus Trichorickettsia mobilis]
MKRIGEGQDQQPPVNKPNTMVNAALSMLPKSQQGKQPEKMPDEVVLIQQFAQSVVIQEKKPVNLTYSPQQIIQKQHEEESKFSKIEQKKPLQQQVFKPIVMKTGGAFQAMQQIDEDPRIQGFKDRLINTQNIIDEIKQKKTFSLDYIPIIEKRLQLPSEYLNIDAEVLTNSPIGMQYQDQEGFNVGAFMRRSGLQLLSAGVRHADHQIASSTFNALNVVLQDPMLTEDSENIALDTLKVAASKGQVLPTEILQTVSKHFANREAIYTYVIAAKNTTAVLPKAGLEALGTALANPELHEPIAMTFAFVAQKVGKPTLSPDTIFALTKIAKDPNSNPAVRQNAIIALKLREPESHTLVVETLRECIKTNPNNAVGEVAGKILKGLALENEIFFKEQLQSLIIITSRLENELQFALDEIAIQAVADTLTQQVPADITEAALVVFGLAAQKQVLPENVLQAIEPHLFSEDVGVSTRAVLSLTLIAKQQPLPNTTSVALSNMLLDPMYDQAENSSLKILISEVFGHGKFKEQVSAEVATNLLQFVQNTKELPYIAAQDLSSMKVNILCGLSKPSNEIKEIVLNGLINIIEQKSDEQVVEIAQKIFTHITEQL